MSLTLIGVSIATVLCLQRCPRRGGTAESRQHFTEQAQTQKHTQIKLLQNSTIMLVSLVCSHTDSRYFVCIFPQRTAVLSFLHSSAIWIWWGSAPRAPNVETPLVGCKNNSFRNALQALRTQVLELMNFKNSP